MKLIKQNGFTFLLIFVLQGILLSSAFAQSKSEIAINNKCEACKTLLDAENINAFAAGNCRIYQSICNLLSQQNTIILEERTANQYFEGVQEIELSNTTIVLTLENFKENGYEITPKMTLLNEEKEVIEVVETGYFQLYSFDENQNIVAAEGVKTIKKVDKNTNQLMMATMNLPETAKDAAFIQVAFQFTHPATSESIVLKEMIQAITVK
jgi:hypothetical protein